MRKFNFIIYIFLFMSILSLVGMINWASADFKTDVLTSGKYWLDTITTSLSFLGIYTISNLWSRDVQLLKDPDYLHTVAEVKRLSDGLIDADFPEFISEYNRTNKIESWNTIITAKLDKHLKKVNQRVLEELRTPEIWSKKTKRWVEKRDELKSQLVPEWIEENIDYRLIPYPKITVSEIQSGFMSPTIKRDLLKSGHVRTILKERWLWIIGNILINAFLASVIISDGSWGSNEIFNLFKIISGILINGVMGYRNGKGQFETMDLYNINTRKMILIIYGNKKHTKEVTLNG